LAVGKAFANPATLDWFIAQTAKRILRV